MLILAVITAIFVYGMIAAMLGTILPDISERFSLTPSQNGRIAAAQALGLIIASVGVGPVLDAEGKKLGLILGLTFISIALFALPRSSSFRSILFLLFLLGVGGGIIVTGANALVSDVGAAQRAAALNLVNLFLASAPSPRLSFRLTCLRGIGYGSVTPLHHSPWSRLPYRSPPRCRYPAGCSVFSSPMLALC